MLTRCRMLSLLVMTWKLRDGDGDTGRLGLSAETPKALCPKQKSSGAVTTSTKGLSG